MTLIARGVITRSFNTSPTSISFQPRSQETFMWSMPTRTLLGRVRVLWLAWRFSLELFIQQNFRSSFHAGTTIRALPVSGDEFSLTTGVRNINFLGVERVVLNPLTNN